MLRHNGSSLWSRNSARVMSSSQPSGPSVGEAAAPSSEWGPPARPLSALRVDWGWPRTLLRLCAGSRPSVNLCTPLLVREPDLHLGQRRMCLRGGWEDHRQDGHTHTCNFFFLPFLFLGSLKRREGSLGRGQFQSGQCCAA